MRHIERRATRGRLWLTTDQIKLVQGNAERRIRPEILTVVADIARAKQSQLWCIWVHTSETPTRCTMELNRFRPYSFVVPSEILQMHLRHLMQYMVRMDFTKAEFYHCRIRLNFERLRLCIYWTAINWSIILTLVAIFLGLLPLFDRFLDIYREVVRIKQYELFMSVEIIGFTAIEMLW